MPGRTATRPPLGDAPLTFTHLMIWAGAWRYVLFGVGALILWSLIFIIYFSRDVRRFWEHRKPHRWEVDMQNKVARREGGGGIRRG
jgi:hypothetical protein